MALRPTLLLNSGGTLAFNTNELGTIASAHVDLFDIDGEQLVTAAAATITPASGATPAELSYTVDGAVVCAVLGDNLRACWTFVVGGATKIRNQTFDVVIAQIYPTLVFPSQLANYYPILEGRDFLGVSKQQDMIAAAWADLLNRIRGFGKNPNRMIDPSPLEAAHAALAASYIARNYKPGSSQQPSDWPAWAAERAEEASQLLRTVMSNYPWYDTTEDLKPSIDEEHMGLQNIRLSR